MSDGGVAVLCDAQREADEARFRNGVQGHGERARTGLARSWDKAAGKRTGGGRLMCGRDGCGARVGRPRGVGPITALAFVLIIGTPERFPRGKQIGSYVGLIPGEDSSAGHQRLGHITKQGSSLLRFLLVEAAQAAARCDADWRGRYLHLAMRRQRNIAKVAMARRLGVRLYWRWRNGWEYVQLVNFGSHAGQLGTGHGVQ